MYYLYEMYYKPIIVQYCIARWVSQVALVVKNPPANAGDARDTEFSPWVRTIPWRRAWQLPLVFLPGESQGQEPGGLWSIGSQRVGHD